MGRLPTCQTQLNRTLFSPVTGAVPAGGTCPSAEDVCMGGTCSPGCVIGGSVVAPLAFEPDAGTGLACCAPALSTSLWTAQWQSPIYGVGQGPFAIILANLGNPIGPDLVTANSTDGTVSVLSNLGQGSFAPAKTYYVSDAGQVNNVNAADLNGDGLVDLVVGGASPGIPISILFGQDGGTYALPFNIPRSYDMVIGASQHFFPTGPPGALIVYNETTYAVDILGALSDGGVGVLSSTPVAFTWGNPHFDAQAVVADLNGDGLDDFAVSNGTIAVMLNDGTGHLQGAATYAAGYNGQAPYGGIAAAPFLGHTYSNGKPALDLVATFANGGEYIEVLQNNGSGSFTLDPVFTTYATGSSSGIAAGDFNGDGIQDIAVDPEDSDTHVLYGDGTGGFTMGPVLTGGAAPFASGFSIVAGPIGPNGTDAIASVQQIYLQTTELGGALRERVPVVTFILGFREGESGGPAPSKSTPIGGAPLGNAGMLRRVQPTRGLQIMKNLLKAALIAAGLTTFVAPAFADFGGLSTKSIGDKAKAEGDKAKTDANKNAKKTGDQMKGDAKDAANKQKSDAKGAANDAKNDAKRRPRTPRRTPRPRRRTPRLTQRPRPTTPPTRPSTTSPRAATARRPPPTRSSI